MHVQPVECSTFLDVHYYVNLAQSEQVPRAKNYYYNTKKSQHRRPTEGKGKSRSKIRLPNIETAAGTLLKARSASQPDPGVRTKHSRQAGPNIGCSTRLFNSEGTPGWTRSRKYKLCLDKV